MSVRPLIIDTGITKRLNASSDSINAAGYEVSGVALASTHLSDAANLIRTAQTSAQNITPASGDIKTLVVRASSGIGASTNVFEIQDSGGTPIFQVNNAGDLTVAGGETIVGSITFTDNITFGNDASDVITFADSVSVVPANDGLTDIGSSSKRFGTVYLDTLGDSGQALTVAANLESNLNWTVKAGDGADDTAGYTLGLSAGDGGADVSSGGGAGGAVTLRAGDGGDDSGNSAGAGGALTIRGGDAGTVTTGIPGAGGDLTIRGGNASDGTVNGGDLYLDSGSGSAPNVYIGQTNASAVTIGASGGNEPSFTLNGALTQTGSGNSVSFAGDVGMSNGLTLTSVGLTMTGLDIGATAAEIGDVYTGGSIRLGETTDPANVVSKGFIYAKSDGGDTELFYRGDPNSIVQITKDGAVNAGGTSSLQTAYGNGATITTAGSTDIVFTLASGGFQVTGGGAGALNVDSASDFSGNMVVSGTASITISSSGAINQTGTGQVDFGGNVDANAGLDVSGGALTVANQAITQTTGGQVTFAGNVDANAGLDIAGGNLSIANTYDIIGTTDGGSDLGSASIRFGTVYADTIGDSGQALAMGGSSLSFADNVTAVFGTGSDASIGWDGTELDITASGAPVHVTASVLDVDGNLTVSGTTDISGTTNAIFDVNSDHGAGDADATLRLSVYDGTAVAQWDLAAVGANKQMAVQYGSTTLAYFDGGNEQVIINSESVGDDSMALGFTNTGGTSLLQVVRSGLDDFFAFDIGSSGTPQFQIGASTIKLADDMEIGETTAGVGGLHGATTGMTIGVPDNVASAFVIEDDAANNDFVKIVTTTGSEAIVFGNTTDNPDYTFLGSGAIDVSDGTLDVPAGTSFKINGSALTTANFTAANIDTLLDGSDASALHTHTGLSGAVDIVLSFTAGETIVAGDALFMASTTAGGRTIGRVYKADANASSLEVAKCFGIAKTGGAAASSIDVWCFGQVTGLSSLSPGVDYYLSGTAGTITSTAPSSSGEYVVYLGMATSSTTLLLNPARPIGI